MVSDSRIGISQNTDFTWKVVDKSGISMPVQVQIPGQGKLASTAFSNSTIHSDALQDGSYLLSIGASDVSGNFANREIEIIIDREPPKTSLKLGDVNPEDIRGLLSLSLVADDPNIRGVFLDLGDKNRMNVTGMSEYLLDTAEVPDGKYDLTLVATDIAGNEAKTVAPIVVANSAPQIMLGILAGMASGGGIASIAWFLFSRRRPTNKS